MTTPHITKVFFPGTFTRTFGGLDDGASTTLVYRDFKVVAIIHNPPVGPHPISSVGDVALSVVASATQYSHMTNDPALKSYLEGVASEVSTRFAAPISTFVEAGTEERAVA
jgi:hypothetical protein